MKKFSIPANFNGQISNFTIYIGEPESNHHPIHFQSTWLSKERGGVIPAEIMNSIGKLHEISKKNKVSLEDLCVYSLGIAQQEELSPEVNEQNPENEE